MAMQIKIFEDGPNTLAYQNDEINEFIKTHDVIQNGIVTLPDRIVVIYMEPLTDREVKLKKLQNTLNIFNDQYVEAVINYNFYLKLEGAGKGGMTLSREIQTPMGPAKHDSTVSAQLVQAKAGRESIKAQIVVIREMMADPEKIEVGDEPSIYNQKQYKPKDGKDTLEPPVPFPDELK